MTKQKLSFYILVFILFISGIYFGHQGFISYRIDNFLKAEQSKANIKLQILLPLLQSTDSLSRHYGCKYLCSLAISSPIDRAVPRLHEIADSDMFMQIKDYGGVKSFGSKSSGARRKPAVSVEYTHPIDTSYPIREAAKSAIELNNSRHLMDSLLKAYPGPFSSRVVSIYLKSKTGQNGFPISGVQPHATYEFNKIAPSHKIKELQKFKPKSSSEFCLVIYSLSDHDNKRTSRFVDNNASWINASFDSRYWCHDLLTIRNKKLLETARKIVTTSPTPPENPRSVEWHMAVNYLVANRDHVIIDNAIALLGDTTKGKPLDHFKSQGQSNSRLRAPAEYPLEYLFKTNAYNRLADIYRLPGAPDIPATDLNVIIFKKLWEAGLKDEIKISAY